MTGEQTHGHSSPRGPRLGRYALAPRCSRSVVLIQQLSAPPRQIASFRDVAPQLGFDGVGVPEDGLGIGDILS